MVKVEKCNIPIKKDATKQIIKGIVYEPLVEDTHGDFMTAEEIEKSAYNFMRCMSLHNVDKQHDFNPNQGFVCESYIVQKNDPDGYPEGAWVVAIKVTDAETWEQVEKSEIAGLSMAGIAKSVVQHDSIPNE
jgi:hypothetical protein